MIVGVQRGLGTNRLSIFMLHNFTQWFSTDLKEGDESTIKLKEADKACHILNKFGLRPRTEEVVL